MSGEKMNRKILKQINEELKKSPIDWAKVRDLEKQFFGENSTLILDEASL